MTDCIFCKIASGEIPCKKVYEDSTSLAFLDINPRNPGHTLVIPKRHAQDIFTISEGDASELMKAIRAVSIGVQKATGAKGINLLQNNGQLAGQVVPHIHFHIIPRTDAEKGMGLEGVIPPKPQDEPSLDAMAHKILKATPKPSASRPAPKPEPEPEPVQEEPAKEEEPNQDKGNDEGLDPRKQRVSFDF